MTGAQNTADAQWNRLILLARFVNGDEAMDLAQSLRSRMEQVEEERDEQAGHAAQMQVLLIAAQERGDNYQTDTDALIADRDRLRSRMERLETTLREANAVLLDEPDAVEAATKASVILSLALNREEAPELVHLEHGDQKKLLGMLGLTEEKT